ncbi:MAG: T9SS type A sorting domain-containing protein, partial [Chlorobi bacterium]|nr:T9SS type A sorting domain-containing protein [Chlorobiota bacterium]
NVPVLTNNGNYNISEAAKLWIDGGNAAVTGNALVPYGEFYISDGTFDALVTHGIAIRANGVIRVSGGEVNTNIIRTASSSASTNRGAYVQTGGVVNIKNQNNSTSDYYHFCLTYSDMTFSMSGGTLHVYDANGTDTSEGGIFIACASENINVTGGTVIAEIATVDNPFKITSTAPFYNLILRNTYDTETDHILSEATDVGPLDVDLAAQPIVVLNDLIIEDNCFLDHNGQDVTVGGGLSIAENSQQQGTNNYGLLYDSGKPNTLTFNGTGSDTLYIAHNADDGYELYVYHLVVDMDDVDAEIVLKGDTLKDPTLSTLSKEYYNRLLRIEGTTDIKKGILNQGHQSIRTYGDVIISKNGKFGVYEAGITPLSAYMMVKIGAVLDAEDGAEIGNLKLNPGDGNLVSIANNVYIKRIGYYNGLLNLNTYNAKVDYLHRRVSEDNVDASFCNTTRMIYSEANASDGGLSILITGNGTYTFPLGTTANSSTRYTYAEVTITDFVDSGYITIRPVDGELKTTNLSGGDLLDYYWRVSYDGFSTLPTVQYKFAYDPSTDDLNGTDDTFYPGKVLDGGDYTRSYEDDLTKVDDDSENATYTITFNDDDSGGSSGFTLENANYTAGVADRFTGTVDKYYSYYDKEGGTGNGWYNNWDDADTWDKGSVGSGVHEVPSEGSVVYIQDRARVWGNSIPNTPAQVIFEFNSAEYGDETDQENVPRLQFNKSGTFDIGRVSGIGMVSFDNNDDPVVNADWGEFATNPSNFIMYWGADQVHTDIIQPCPSLMIEGSTQKVDQNITIGGNLILTGKTNFTPLQDIHVNGNLYVGAWDNGVFHFPDTGSPLTITVDGDVDYTYINSSGDRDIVVDNSGNNIEHKLIVKGDIIQGSDTDYTLDLFSAQGETNVILELQGESNNSYSNYSGNPAELYRLIVNKGSSQDSSFTFNDSFTLNGTTSGVDIDKALELQNGTLILKDSDIDINLTTGDDNFEIPSTAALQVDSGVVRASGNSGILLDGKITVNGGTVDMSGGDNYIQYSASGNATIEVSDGILKVGSQVRRGTTSTEGVLIYNQSGGEVIIGTDDAGEDSRGMFEILNAGSSFTHTGGKFIIANDFRTNASVASMYFAPEDVTVTSDTITFGMDGTTKGNFTLYAGKALEYLEVDTTGTKLTLSVVPCTVNKELIINKGAGFDANGLDLTLKGDFNNDGTFTSNKNATYFIPSVTAVNIKGQSPVTFYDLYKQVDGTTLTLDTTITVTNELHLEAGGFNDGGHVVNCEGDMYIDIDITSSGTTESGLVANGTEIQTLTCNTTLSKLKIDNPQGVEVPTGYNITISDTLKLKQGILDIGKNLLTLTKNATIVAESPFGENNMIRTNISFTDAGVKKYFPVISSETSFTYPIGSGTKYTPVTLNISNNDADNCYIRVKAADELHPSIINDTDDPEIADTANVLRYYWILDAEGVSGFIGEAVMQGYPGDVYVTDPYTASDYITARLLSRSSGTWDKYVNTDFNENTTELTFSFSNTDDIGIDGDYTAGIDDAIPDKVALYVSLADDLWTDPNTWGKYDETTETVGDPGVDVPAGGPKGARVLVKTTVSVPDNYLVSYETSIDNSGKLDLGTTFGHRLGNVEGTGVLYMESGDLPAGDYEGFLAVDSGTVEYGGTGEYDILSEMPFVNNIIVSGTGTRNMPNIDVQLYGDLTIDGPVLVCKYDNDIYLKDTLNLVSGSFDANNSSTVIFNGSSAQVITGNGFTDSNNSDFVNLEIDNSAGLNLNTDVEITGNLYLTSGVINCDETNTLTITNSTEDCVLGGSNSSYVAGPLYKNIISSQSFVFPVGDNGRLGKIGVKSDGSSGDIWMVQYFNHSAGDDGMSLDSKASDVNTVSGFEYWNVRTTDGTGNANLTLYWDAASGVTPDDGFRIVKWTDDATDEWQNVEVGTKTGTSSSGSADLYSDMSFNEFTSGVGIGNFITFGGGPVSLTYWQGDVAGSETDWFAAENWNTGVVPTSSKDVLIEAGKSYYPVIDNTAEVSINKLSIENGATLTIDPGAMVIVNDTISDGNPTSDPGLIIKNTVSDPTTFIYKGAQDAYARVEWIYRSQQYWYIGHSVDGASNSDYDTPTGGDFKLYRYTGSAWEDITSNTAYDFDASPMEGYAFKKTTSGDVTISHTGVIRNKSYSRSINGWNLVANPYQAYLDVESSGFDIGNSLQTIWTTSHSETTGEIFYATYNIEGLGENGGTRYIAPGQSFWLRNYSASTVTLDSTARTTEHGDSNYSLKSAQLNNENDVLRLFMDNDGDKDELVLAFRYYGDFDKFTRYDSDKRFGKAINVPNVYAEKAGHKAAICTFSDEVLESDSIFVGYTFSQSKEIVLRASNINEFTAVENVYLFDKVTGVEVNLRETPEYVFTSVAGGETDRFVLYFDTKANDSEEGEVVTDITDKNADEVIIYGNRNNAIVIVSGQILSESNGKGLIKVYDSVGKLIKEVKLTDKRISIQLPSAHNIYIIEVNTGKQVYTGKVSGM